MTVAELSKLDKLDNEDKRGQGLKKIDGIDNSRLYIIPRQ